jgi:hypothetical protein
MSVKTDSYAFAILLLELLTGQTCAEVVALHMEDPDLFTDMQQYVDRRAGVGTWQPAAVSGLAAVAERCIVYQARARATVKDVLPQLAAQAAAAR